MTLKTSAIFVMGLFIFGCNNHAGNKNKNSTNTTPVDPKKSLELSTGENQKASDPKSTFEMLQGKWQSTDDKSSFVVFEKNNRQDLGEGMDSTLVEPFVLSDKCLNESNKETEIPKEKDKYISCPKSDMCWYIVSLDKSVLILSYMGRGNTLTYRKVQ